MSDAVENTETLVRLTADIVSAYVSNHPLAGDEIPLIIRNVHRALGALAGPGGEPRSSPPAMPAVPVRASVRPDHIVCLEDGKKLKTLKRHLMAHYQLTPEAYRAKWRLPADYPMVAPEYAEQRRMLARRIGLGTRPRKD